MALMMDVSKNLNIGIIDADLLYRGTSMPNLASMKISAWHKSRGDTVTLCGGADVLLFDRIYVSKVFTDTQIPQELYSYNCIRGGTGFFGEKAEPLPTEIEHCMPDYSLYDKISEYHVYKDFSIGFTTRGCFRKCPFCVNRVYDRVIPWSDPAEFVDKKRKYIYCLDDNFLAFKDWETVLNKLEATGKRFQFRQGLDIRIMTERMAQRLAKTNYYSDFIFAFDNIRDRELIERKLTQWRKYCKKQTKLYVLSAFYSQGVDDIVSVFERIKILFSYKCLPYVMRYSEYHNSRYRDMYIQIARWTNQPAFVKKKTFREFCMMDKHSEKIMSDFEKEHKDIANTYFDIRF